MNPAQKQTSKAGLAFAMTMVGLTLYWAFTYSGPYRYLAELQLKWFRVYYPELTGMVVILGLLGVFLAIKLLFRGAERPVPGTPSASANTSATNTAAHERWLPYLRYAFLLVPFGMGGYMYYNGTHAGSLHQLNAVDFQSGNLQARVLYTEVRGHLMGRTSAKIATGIFRWPAKKTRRGQSSWLWESTKVKCKNTCTGKPMALSACAASQIRGWRAM